MFQNVLDKIRLKSTFVSLFLILMIPVSTLAAPVIFYTDITSGPNTGGENNNGAYLSIFGKGFGTTQGTSKVTINGAEVAAYKQWGAPSMVNNYHGIQVISVQPGPKVTSGPIVVTVGGENSNSNHTFTVRAGDIYFVALNGNDTTGEIGNINKPFRDVHDTFHRTDFGPGDFIVIRGGIWSDIGDTSGSRWVEIDKGATQTAPFTIYGYPGEEVIYDNALGADSGFGAYISGQTWTFEGFVFANIKFINAVDGSFSLGRYTSDSWHNYFRIVNIGINGPSAGSCAPDAGAIEASRTNHLKVLGVYVKTRDLGCTQQPQYSGAKAIYFSGRTDDAEVGWFVIDNLQSINSGPGIQIRAADYASNPEVHKNIIIHDSKFFDMGRDATTWGQSCGTGMKFYNNIVYNTGTNPDTARGGIYLNSYNLGVEIYNNTFYGQGSGKEALRMEKAANAVIKNNIIMTNSTGENYWSDLGINQSNVVASNNIYYGSSQAVPSWDTNPINQDPLFIDPTSPARNFQLQSKSPAIDAGISVSVARDINGALRPQGIDFDIGAYEYCESNCPVADTTPPSKPIALKVQ